jgi:hypothetical protein
MRLSRHGFGRSRSGGAAPDLERDALIPHLFGQSSACSAKKEHFEHESYGAPARISAGFRKAEQIGSGRCPGSRGRRFKSCQPDRQTASDLLEREIRGGSAFESEGLIPRSFPIYSWRSGG